MDTSKTTGIGTLRPHLMILVGFKSLKRSKLGMQTVGFCSLAMAMGMLGLTPRKIECAKRWKHSLDPSIDRSKWTEVDDARLLKAVERYGHDWRAIIIHEFHSRSPTNVKNR